MNTTKLVKIGFSPSKIVLIASMAAKNDEKCRKNVLIRKIRLISKFTRHSWLTSNCNTNIAQYLTK